ncbi:MAG: hypothetical protein M5U28_47115 [Sandaracinaceae bacterium]|nr:hypothetical protein [Sandaracinaceae bacterium]
MPRHAPRRLLVRPPVRPLEGDAGHRGGPPVPELDAGTPLSLADAGAVAAPDAGAPSGAVVRVHLRATEEPIEHEAGTAGQMPRAWVSGIRSLHLLRSRDDTAPALVFSHGDGYVEASYADGADTVVGTVPIASLTPGRFSYARVVHTHTRFTIDATMHAGYGPMPGTFEDLIVFSDRTSIGGVAHDHGHYESVFETGGLRFPTQGEGLALPPLSSGGFEVSLEDGELVSHVPDRPHRDRRAHRGRRLRVRGERARGLPLDRRERARLPLRRLRRDAPRLRDDPAGRRELVPLLSRVSEQERARPRRRPGVVLLSAAR